jgi:glycosyltransferase involved in cell wall biosynthesis
MRLMHPEESVSPVIQHSKRTVKVPSILHVGSIAGVPQELSRAQRRLGCKSDIIIFQTHPYDYEADFFRPTKLPFPLKYAQRMHSISKIVSNYEIIHFHYFSVLPFGWDLPIWKMLNKKIIFHYHGDDIRNKGEGILSMHFADEVLVSTPDLLAWSTRAKWIPNPVDLKKFRYVGTEDHEGKLRILHAPSDPGVKGTEHVLKAVEDLKEEGYEIELDLVRNLPHQEALEHYRQADIVVDQLLVGWYGVFAIECMALGKPVCVYIQESLKSRLPTTLPLVATTPFQLKDDLRKLIEEPALRIRIGRAARMFAEQVHDADKIAKYLIDKIY